jgi:hypothetical protein
VRFLTLLPVVLAWVFCAALAPQCHAARNRPLVGAIRWDAWTRWAGETGWASYEKCLGPRQWHYRVPFFGKVVSDDSVEIRGDTQEIMDQEIAYAVGAGLDYWAFDWYHPRSWKDAENMTRCLDLYLSSKRPSDLAYCLILLGGPHLGARDEWPATVDGLVERFRDARYQKVMGDRPLVYLFCIDEFLAWFGGEQPARAAVDLLRGRCVAAGLGTPYLALMTFWPAQGARQLEVLGADALSAYANPPGNDGVEQPFSYALSLNRWFWGECEKTGKALIPTVTAGWDYRPMKRAEFPDRDLKNNWFAHGTPEEVAAHLAAGLDWVRQHPAMCPANTVVIYAWNELSEGGWIVPTLDEGTARLDALQRVLQAAEKP